MHNRMQSIFPGCLLGGAIGDALGWPVEFLTIAEIRERFGPAGILDFAEADGGGGAITDDTQMTLFTAEGLLNGLDSGSDCVASLYAAYLRWLRTQEVVGPQSTDTGLLSIHEMYADRAPGNTCLDSLESGLCGTTRSPLNHSKGCGGVMRVAPVGLFCAALHRSRNQNEVAQEAFEMGCAAAAVTHGHPTGYLSAGAFAALIALIAGDMPLEPAVLEIITILKGEREGGECVEALQSALVSWSEVGSAATPEAIEELGTGETGEEALAISIFCALAADGDFEKGVRYAVNHSGDSDSTGAITGNILGALLGEGSIPSRWLSQVELRETIEGMALSLLGLQH